MKKIIMIFFVVFLMGSMNVLANESSIPEFRTGVYDAEGELVTVTVHGMVCDFCAQAIDKVFMKQEAVSGVNVDLSTKEVLLSLKEGSSLEDEKINELIEWAGYDVAGITR